MSLLLLTSLIVVSITAAVALMLPRFMQNKRADQTEDLEIERAINYFSNSLIGQNTPEEILWDITHNCISRLKFEDCVIYLLDEDRRVFIQKATYGPKNPADYEIYLPIEIPVGIGIVGTVGATGVAEIVPDTSKDSRYIVDDHRRFSEITVPIIYHGQVIGVIDSEHQEKGFFKEKHLRILSTIASLCASKIMRLRLENAYRLAEMKLHENNLKIAETRLATLRLQMNPHFIFNSITSINNFISKNDTANASGYLDTFSKLVGQMFDNSHSEWITLEKEISTLKLYLELEKIRLQNKFDIVIQVSPDLDPATVLVPNLLIHPFIENAILHGLLHKENGKGELCIRYWTGNGRVYISVEDNGVGINASELRNGKLHRLGLKGLTITEERIRIINEMYDAHLSFTLTDLEDENGNPAGTRAFVSMLINDAASRSERSS